MQNDQGQTLVVALPFTIEFDITRNTLSSANVCQVRIYNLSEKNRNSLRYNATNYGQYRGLQLRAGYNDDLSVIFKGNISQAWSFREGTNLITQIECYDGGFAFNNGVADFSAPEGSPNRSVLKGLAGSLPNVSLGAVGNFSGNLPRGNSYAGNTAKAIGELTGGAMFIDNEVVNILQDDEYIQDFGPTLVINAETGLLATPILEVNIARFEMLFEPKLAVGRLVRVESATDFNYNGLYKVTEVKHKGVISEVVSGSATTGGGFIFFEEFSPVATG